MTDGYLLPAAAIDWQDGTPVSTQYGDIYWHRGAALAEKKAVFVDPAIAAAAGHAFTIAELGFGFGLNCLLTAEHWPHDVPLQLISIEKHPVPYDQLRRLLARYDFRYAASLLSQYPPAYRGQHVIWLADRIRLLLVFEDVAMALANLDARVDFWYLDGFAPARNDAMWAKDLYRQMFSRSRPGAGLATYSAASRVRNGLAAAGFEVDKRAGYGHKKEMLGARKPGNWLPREAPSGETVIVGAGLAGRYCAEALAQRGLPCTLIDSGEPGPSNIAQLTVFPQLARAAERRYRFSLAASRYMQTSPGYHASGLRWFGRTPEETQRLLAIARLFPDGIIEALDDDSVRFLEAGWLAPDELPPCPLTRETVTALQDTGHGWVCRTRSGRDLQSDKVILAPGFNRELLAGELGVRGIRGQAVSVASSGITEVLNGLATVFPTYRGRSVISGTYARSTSVAVNDQDTQELLDLAARYATFDRADVQAMVGIRAVSRDRLPIVGPAPVWAALADTNRLSTIRELQAGLYLCTAFGSRGASHARLCAEQVVSNMLGEPAALGLKEQEMLSPARFVLRDSQAAD